MDVHNADLKRRQRPASAKFGSEKRFKDDPKALRTPGPIYNPPLNPKRPQSAKYSFGFRRERPGESPIAPMIGTTPIVGPSTYFKSNRFPYSSKNIMAPAHAIPKELKLKELTGKTISETYED